MLSAQVLMAPVRSFIARTEMYQRGLAMTKRLYELADQHGWSDEEAKLAVRVIDEPLPIMLHNAGRSSCEGQTCSTSNTARIAFEPVVRSQGSSELNKHYDELKARHGIIGYAYKLAAPIPLAHYGLRREGAIFRLNSVMGQMSRRSRQQRHTSLRRASSSSTHPRLRAASGGSAHLARPRRTVWFRRASFCRRERTSDHTCSSSS